ncbi:MAG: adenine phosphoribosyltransferase [Gammaproteobacteria bacterium]|nr:adenine phosphoribosyltransferase [Gammaproteobacteria bacterium]
MDLKSIIRDIPDFPKPGIVFRDITTLLQNPEGLRYIIDHFSDAYSDQRIDYVLGIESRGFIFGAPLAYKLGAGFVPVRKAGKLPAQTHSIEYELEYGTDRLEIHKDAVQPGSQILVVDDLIATGGTAAATAQLIDQLDCRVIAFAFVIELSGLGGRDKLPGAPIKTIIKY